jgi:ubiquinone/menaquinone biosynthesis C-methylase UbiE
MISNSAAKTATKSSHVKEVFENTPRYLDSRGLDIRMRAETVKTLASRLTFESILDIGCGDGSISLPLLNGRNRATLLDFSSNMTALARSRVPAEFAGNVEVRNEDFMKASFGPTGFDLIICLGVVAHVDSAEEFIGKLASLLNPGGYLIFEFTDAFHFSGRLARLRRGVVELLAPPRFSVNLFSFKTIATLLEARALRIVSSFRYGFIPVPGLRVLGRNALYRFTRFLYGSCEHSRTQWLGNEYICLLTTLRSK